MLGRLKGRRTICLVPFEGPDRFVSVPLADGNFAYRAHCGAIYQRTNRKTDGGWQIFKQITDYPKGYIPEH